MSQIWFISDTHFGHANLVRGSTTWENKTACRNFNSLKEHDDTIINNINKYVQKNDILYHLGDWSMGGRVNIQKYRERVNCDTIHLCLGNHDVIIQRNPLLIDSDLRTQSLFTSVNQIINKKIGKTHFVMCHNAFRTWDRASYGSIMLHGHSHDNLTPYQRLLQIADDDCLYKTGDYYKQEDMSMESLLRITGEMRPLHISEIHNIMEKRINLNVDHH